MDFKNTIEFAQQMDQKDPLKDFRGQFHIPKLDGKESIYFCGNSLGLQPKTVKQFIEQELEDWAKMGVEGHFHGKNPWYYYHHFLEEKAANIVGANKKEVVIMNSLTVNLHLLMLSFYRPAPHRFKILIEHPAFPSDQYAVASQARLNSFFPEEAVVPLKPRKGEETLRTKDILAKIEELGNELALVMFGGVNYYTGQLFDMQTITKAAHKVGALAGFDLAHAAGNALLNLHDWNVDFAVWCSYKYLNSGPGGTSGAFVHEKHGNNPAVLRLAGWWGNDENTRFEMEETFVPQKGAAGWQLSNAQILPMAAHWASLEIFEAAGMKNIRQKGDLLTGYLEFLLNDLNKTLKQTLFTIITPKDLKQRGCQLSVFFTGNGKQIFEELQKEGVIADWREPSGDKAGIMRIAPAPLYNTFEEVWRFVSLLKNLVS